MKGVPKMKKKRLALVAAVLGVVLFSGCSKPSETEVKTTKDKNEEITFYIVRHGKTMLNTTDRVQGWSDAFLTKSGEEVVTKAGKGMSDIEFQSAYSSDSGRAMQTADLILKENKTSSQLDVTADKRLREFNFGTFEGDLNENMWSEVAKSQNQSMEQFLENMTMESFANGVATLDKEKNKDGKNWPAEDYQTIVTRLEESMTEMAKNESEKSGSGNVLVVSHGLSIAALLDKMFPDFEMPEGGIKNAAVCVVTYKDNQFSLKKVNDTSYID